MNVISITGRMAGDPELRTTGNGTNVATFNVAVQRKYKDESGNFPCDFLRCVAWRQSADFVNKYFHKGDSIAIVGELQIRKWTDNNNNKRETAEIIVGDVSFCGSKSSTPQASATPEQAPAQNPDQWDLSSDDIPF